MTGPGTPAMDPARLATVLARLATVLADVNLLAGLDLDDGSVNVQAAIFDRDLLRVIWLYLKAPVKATTDRPLIDAELAARVAHVAGVIEDTILDPRCKRASIEILTGMAAEKWSLSRDQLAAIYAADLTGDETPPRP